MLLFQTGTLPVEHSFEKVFTYCVYCFVEGNLSPVKKGNMPIFEELDFFELVNLEMKLRSIALCDTQAQAADFLYKSDTGEVLIKNPGSRLQNFCTKRGLTFQRIKNVLSRGIHDGNLKLPKVPKRMKFAKEFTLSYILIDSLEQAGALPDTLKDQSYDDLHKLEVYLMAIDHFDSQKEAAVYLFSLADGEPQIKNPGGRLSNFFRPRNLEFTGIKRIFRRARQDGILD
ncbi:hypothetical protein [Ferrimonas marina]|uniref:Uncharacterized protein n=1 Tax=Ferrimonas marina TaxID=299255 RepID=A0A1M5UD03_9GAMM|nr:hypothetical protein [Ferrimonas marina]SHH60788.1 hypothetical protein SAMN02745129_2507 [Ferrimonas marina]